MEVQSSTCLGLNRRNSGSKPHDFQDLEIWTEIKLEADSKSAQLPWVMFIYLYAFCLFKKCFCFLVWWNPHGNQAQVWIHLWRCPKSWSYPQFSIFWVGIFHENHPAGGIPHDDETQRTPISRTCPPSASLSVGWAWEVILHPWMEPRKSPRRRTVKRRPGTAMRELDRNKGQKWNLMGFSCMAYGILWHFMA